MTSIARTSGPPLIVTFAVAPLASNDATEPASAKTTANHRAAVVLMGASLRDVTPPVQGCQSAKCAILGFFRTSARQLVLRFRRRRVSGGTLMRVLLSTIGSRGDVQPLVALAVQLKELAQDVRVCAPSDLGAWIEGLSATSSARSTSRRCSRESPPWYTTAARVPPPLPREPEHPRSSSPSITTSITGHDGSTTSESEPRTRPGKLPPTRWLTLSAMPSSRTWRPAPDSSRAKCAPTAQRPPRSRFERAQHSVGANDRDGYYASRLSLSGLACYSWRMPNGANR